MNFQKKVSPFTSNEHVVLFFRKKSAKELFILLNHQKFKTIQKKPSSEVPQKISCFKNQ